MNLDELALRAARAEVVTVEEALEKVEEAFDALKWRLEREPTRGRVLRLARLLIHPRRKRKRRRVPVTVEEITLMGGWDNVTPIPSIAVTCTECQMSAEAYGRGEDSVTYACASLAADCGEWNFYDPEETLL